MRNEGKKLNVPLEKKKEDKNYRPESVSAPLQDIQGSLRESENVHQESTENILEGAARIVPAVLFDGGTVEVTMEEHDEAIDWCRRVLGMNIVRQEKWTPSPQAVVGKMTQMGWGVWIESGTAEDGTSVPAVKLEPFDSNIRWCWSIRNLKKKHEEFQQLDVQISDIYTDPQGRKAFDFRVINSSTWLTAIEDPTLKDDSFTDTGISRIRVKDLQQSIKWYKHFIGMEVSADHSNNKYCVMTLGVNYQPEGRSEWVLEEDPDLTDHGPIDGLFRTRTFVGNREAYFEYYRFLQESGVHVSELGGYTKRGRVFFHVYDLDGNRFDISHC